MRPRAIATPLAVALCACLHPEFSDFCNKAVRCIGGNDRDVAACEDQIEDGEDEAADYGCSDKFDALAECATSSGSCQTYVDPDTHVTEKSWFSPCCDQTLSLWSCEYNAGREIRGGIYVVGTRVVLASEPCK